MRKILTIVVLFQSVCAYAQNTDTSLVEFNDNFFYHIKRDSSTGLLIFLHGGVENPVFSNHEKISPLEFLIERNQNFIHYAVNKKFDVLIPVKNDSLNWLTNHKLCFRVFKSYIDSCKKRYVHHFISGFSDGGTGSYKIFYDFSEFFNGVVLFNGYPQHKNHNKSVDYTKISNKKVIFFSTFKDNVIPYEFALTEYSKQKAVNPDTYLYITKGKHTFKEYGSKDFELLFDMISTLPDNKETNNIHAYIRGDKVIEFYRFRKKIIRKYNYGRSDFEENKKQRKMYER